MTAEPSADGVIERRQLAVLSNEFTAVVVSLATTPVGQRLELRNVRTGEAILLDPVELEILTVQRPEAFTELFRRQLDGI